MTSRTFIHLGIASVLVATGSVTEVFAGCNPTKDFKLAYSEEGDYFLNFPADANTVIGGGVLKGRFWQAGARATANESGACPEQTYLLDTGPSQLTFFGQSGGDVLGTGPCDNSGCVVGAQVILIQTLSNDSTNAYYAVGKVNETIGEFRYNRGGTDWLVTAVPRPEVTFSLRQQPSIVLNLEFDPPSGAHGEADGFARSSILTGYQLVRFVGLSEPGRLPASWTNFGPVLPVTEDGAMLTAVTVTCDYSTFPYPDIFLAVRPVFDGGQLLGDYVGRSLRIECDPILAEPRFNNPIDRRKSGRGQIRTR